MFSAVIQVLICFILLVRCQEQTADSYIELPSLPTPRTYLMSATVNSDIYVFGGVQEGKSSYALSKVEKFSPSSNSSWTSLSEMPVALHSGSATFYNNHIYIIGGFTNGWTLSNSSFLYDHILDTWTEIARMPTSRGGLSSVWVNNKLYAIGGYDGKNFLKTVEIYDPTTNSWTAGPALNYPRERFVAGAINKKIYAVAGRGPSNMDIVESLDPSSSSPSWQILDSRINTNRSSFGGVTYGNRILIFGGESGKALTVVEDLLVDTMEWRCRGNMPTARQGFSASISGTIVYLIGGGTGTGLSSSNINQAYFPADNFEPSTCQKSTQLTVPTSSGHRLSVFVYMLALLLIIVIYV